MDNQRTALNSQAWTLLAGATLILTTSTCKTIDYNPALVEAPPMTDAVPLPDGEYEFKPAVACANPMEAVLSIENFAYNIVCGCEEESGKTCTLLAGTNVTWRFADSEEHNVTSIPNNFGMSGDTLAGTFDWSFDDRGEYGYGCTIHIADMAGYLIIAK